jgi:hypothetical protein
MKRVVFLMLAGLMIPAVRAVADLSVDDDKMGTISGTEIKRLDGGGWLGLELKDNSFVLTFYTAKKKPTPADRSAAVLRWPVHYQPNPERTELAPTSDPAVFSSPYPVKPPHSFNLHITLLSDSKDAVESYDIAFSE